MNVHVNVNLNGNVDVDVDVEAMAFTRGMRAAGKLAQMSFAAGRLIVANVNNNDNKRCGKGRKAERQGSETGEKLHTIIIIKSKRRRGGSGTSARYSKRRCQVKKLRCHLFGCRCTDF